MSYSLPIHYIIYVLGQLSKGRIMGNLNILGSKKETVQLLMVGKFVLSFSR